MILEAAVTELTRRLANMVRFGRVAMVDHAKRRVRVQSGDILTSWLRWQTSRAGTTRTWSPPTVGEQVMIISPSGEPAAGFVIPAFYCDDHDAPDESPDTHVIEFSDGARISYNHVTHHLEATGIDTALVDAGDAITLRAGTSITLDAPLVHSTGQHKVDDLLTYGNGIAGTGGENNNSITGPLTQTGGNLSSNGVVVHTHHHSGVQPGSGNTGAPA